MRAPPTRVAAMLVVLSFLGTLGYRSTIPVASFYAREALGATAFAVGGLTAAFYLARAGAAVGSGYASSTPRRAGLIASISFAGHVGLVAYLYSGPGYWGLVAVRGMQGVLNGLAWTSAQVLLASVTPPRWRGRAFAVYGIAGSAGAMAGDALYASLGLRCLVFSAASFLASSLIAVASSRMASRALGASGAPVGAPPSTSRAGVAAVRPAALLALVAAVSYISVMGVGDIAYIYYREALGITPGEASLLRGVAGFAGTLAGFGLGWLADVGGAYTAMLASYLASLAGAFLIPIPNLYVAGLGIALMTAAGRAFLPTARKVASEYPRGHVYLGYLGAASNIASATGGLSYGYIYAALDSEKICLAGHCLVAAPLLAASWTLIVPLLLSPPRGRDKAPGEPAPGG